MVSPVRRPSLTPPFIRLYYEQYGFAKARRGPDTDMYAHPSFVRGEPDMLTQLRKSTSSSRRRLSSKRSGDDSDSSSDDGNHNVSSPTAQLLRSVSPSPTRLQPAAPLIHQVPRLVLNPAFNLVSPTATSVGQTWLTFNNEQPVASKIEPARTNATPRILSKEPTSSSFGGGRLHLLTLAIEQGGC